MSFYLKDRYEFLAGEINKPRRTDREWVDLIEKSIRRLLKIVDSGILPKELGSKFAVPFS